MPTNDYRIIKAGATTREDLHHSLDYGWTLLDVGIGADGQLYSLDLDGRPDIVMRQDVPLITRRWDYDGNTYVRDIFYNAMRSYMPTQQPADFVAALRHRHADAIAWFKNMLATPIKQN